MGEISQNTNLASEYYVLSMLYRLGLDAYLTIGNKKSVDIIVHKNNKILTIDVKGLKGKSNFPIDNWSNKSETHFLIFVCFLNKIDDCIVLPELFIVPANKMENKYDELNGESIIYENPKGNRKVVQYNRLKKIDKFKNNWDLIC